MRLEFRDLEYGWVTAVVWNGADHFVMNVSGAFETEDGLAQFVDAVLALTRGSSAAEVCWTHESGEHWWTFEQADDHRIRTRIVHVVDPSQDYSPWLSDQALVDERLALLDIVELVLGVMEPLRNPNGLDDYRKNWWHPYPRSTMKALREWRESQ